MNLKKFLEEKRIENNDTFFQNTHIIASEVLKLENDLWKKFCINLKNKIKDEMDIEPEPCNDKDKIIYKTKNSKKYFVICADDKDSKYIWVSIAKYEVTEKKTRKYKFNGYDCVKGELGRYSFSNLLSRKEEEKILKEICHKYNENLNR